MSRSLSFKVDGARREPRRDESRAPSDSAADSLLLTGWRPGFRKVATSTSLRGSCGYPLTEAKAMVDRLLDGDPVRVDIPPTAQADAVRAELEALGVVAEPDRA